MKIKKVEIQAFKSYLKKEDGTFDFTLPSSGLPSNFISLYAPNGFGKTSFFDAVDYAITGKIGRFSRDVTLRRQCEAEAGNLKEKGRRQYLLRNKSAGASDSNQQAEPLTKVMVLASNSTFESDYHLPNKGRCDYNFPPEVEERKEAGHWEIDLIVSGQGKGTAALLTLTERKTPQGNHPKAQGQDPEGGCPRHQRH